MKKIPYQLTRSRRRTIAIYICPDGQVQVKAPYHCPVKLLDAFLEEKQDWVKKNRERRLQEMKDKALFSVQAGDKLRYLGKEYTVLPGEGQEVVFTGEAFLTPQYSWEDLKPLIVKQYIVLAEQFIPPLVEYYARQMKVAPAKVRIGTAKTRWGSCSAKGSLNFTWRLIMAPAEAVEYVVVHELAHLRQLNHSRNFWQIVAEILPNYKQREKQLKSLQKYLEKENWEN